METINHSTMEHAGGTIGGVFGVLTGNILGVITFSGALETAVYALIGGAVGYFTVKGIKYIEKKLEKKK